MSGNPTTNPDFLNCSFTRGTILTTQIVIQRCQPRAIFVKSLRFSFHDISIIFVSIWSPKYTSISFATRAPPCLASPAHSHTLLFYLHSSPLSSLCPPSALSSRRRPYQSYPRTNHSLHLLQASRHIQICLLEQSGLHDGHSRPRWVGDRS